MEHVVYDINKIGAELAVDAAKETTANPNPKPHSELVRVSSTHRPNP